MKREGQGFSLSMIVIAAIALVVMVIIVALVINSAGGINDGVQQCEATVQGAQCLDSCSDGLIRHPTKQCGDGFQCCIPLGSVGGN